jgi:hypothetical protein
MVRVVGFSTALHPLRRCGTRRFGWRLSAHPPGLVNTPMKQMQSVASQRAVAPKLERAVHFFPSHKILTPMAQRTQSQLIVLNKDFLCVLCVFAVKTVFLDKYHSGENSHHNNDA